MDFTTLIPSFGNFAFTILAFVVALSIIVAIHEFGHYIVARWSGIGAEVFSIGMGPTIWSRVDKRGTRWQIAALPIGGYVKFLGDANAASVGGDADVPKARNTMLGAPLWARAATVLAGPVFNFILSFLIFAGLIMYSGQPSSPLTVADLPNWPADHALELEAGDQILSIDGVAMSYPDGFYDAVALLSSAPLLSYEVERAGDVIVVSGPHPTPSFVQSVSPTSAADDAGMRIGDLVLSMNDTPVYTFADMVAAVEAARDTPITLVIWRDGEVIEKVITPRLVPEQQEDGTMTEALKLGIGNGGLFFEAETVAVYPLEALWLGVKNVWYIIKQSLNGLRSMISGAISSCNLAGPISMAQTSGSMASQGAVSFISFIAFLSTAVGLLNLFPIPILDGGHLVFHAYEAITGKPPSDGALRILMVAGLAIILTLMVFAVGQDLFLCP